MMDQIVNSPDIDQHSPTASTTIPDSPSTSVILSLDTIDTAPPSDSESSVITGENVSVKPWGLPVESTNMTSPQSGPFTLHKRFFFEDGNITFLVDGTLYRVHRYFFCRDSNEFITRLSRFPAQEQSSPPVISLENVKTKDLDAFLAVLYPLDFDALEGRSYEELSSILDLSTRWGFTSIRKMAIRCLQPPTPLQRLILGRKYAIEDWILPALQDLCERPLPLAFDEARLMTIEDVILVGSVRESVRSHTLTVESAGIIDCIGALRNGKVWQRQSGGLLGSFGRMRTKVDRK